MSLELLPAATQPFGGSEEASVTMSATANVAKNKVTNNPLLALLASAENETDKNRNSLRLQLPWTSPTQSNGVGAASGAGFLILGRKGKEDDEMRQWSLYDLERACDIFSHDDDPSIYFSPPTSPRAQSASEKKRAASIPTPPNTMEGYQKNQVQTSPKKLASSSSTTSNATAGVTTTATAAASISTFAIEITRSRIKPSGHQSKPKFTQQESQNKNNDNQSEAGAGSNQASEMQKSIPGRQSVVRFADTDTSIIRREQRDAKSSALVVHADHQEHSPTGLHGHEKTNNTWIVHERYAFLLAIIQCSDLIQLKYLATILEPMRHNDFAAHLYHVYGNNGTNVISGGDNSNGKLSHDEYQLLQSDYISRNRRDFVSPLRHLRPISGTAHYSDGSPSKLNESLVVSNSSANNNNNDNNNNSDNSKIMSEMRVSPASYSRKEDDWTNQLQQIERIRITMRPHFDNRTGLWIYDRPVGSPVEPRRIESHIAQQSDVIYNNNLTVNSIRSKEHKDQIMLSSLPNCAGDREHDHDHAKSTNCRHEHHQKETVKSTPKSLQNISGFLPIQKLDRKNHVEIISSLSHSPKSKSNSLAPAPTQLYHLTSAKDLQQQRQLVQQQWRHQQQNSKMQSQKNDQLEMYSQQLEQLEQLEHQHQQQQQLPKSRSPASTDYPSQHQSHGGQSTWHLVHAKKEEYHPNKMSKTDESIAKLQVLLLPLSGRVQYPIRHLSTLRPLFLHYLQANSTDRIRMLTVLIRSCTPPAVAALTRAHTRRMYRDFLGLLPESVAKRLVSYLDPTSITRVAQVSKTWATFARDNMLWRLKCWERGWVLSVSGDEEHMMRPASAGDEGEEEMAHTEETRAAAAAAKQLQQKSKDMDYQRLFRERLLIERSLVRGQYRLQVLQGHSNRVLCFRVLPLKGVLISGSVDRTWRMWSLQSGKCIFRGTGHSGGVWCIAADEVNIFSGSWDTTIKVWDFDTGTCINTLEGHRDTVSSLSCDPHRVFSGSYDTSLRIWSRDNFRCMRVLRGHQGPVYTLQLHDHGRLLSGSGDKTVRVWDIHTGNCLKVVPGHGHAVMSLMAEANRLVTAHFNMLTVWDMTTWKPIATLEGHTGRIESIHLAGSRLISGARDHTVIEWNIHTGEVVQVLKGHGAPVTSVYFTDNMIISGSDDMTIRIFNFIG